MSNNCISFKLKSTNNEYFITIRLLDDKEPQKLEISLKHKLKTGDIDFLLQKSLEELKCENNYLSQFNSIKEIFDYFIKIIKSQNMQIVKPITPNIDFYYMEFFDQEKQIYLQIYIPKEGPIIKELKEKNQKLESKIKYLRSEIDRISNINEGGCKGVEVSIVQSGLSGMGQSNSMQILEKEKDILKENNNNIHFTNEPIDFNNEKIISDEKDECENFTAFTNMNQGSLIVWTIKRKGLINIYDFKKRITTKQEAHNNNINSVQYFHDHNVSFDYIISLSKSDDNIIKIWKIDYEDDNNLLLTTSFTKHFFKREIEIFCIFNYKEYDTENSFLFIYGKSLLIKKNNEYDVNAFKNKEIICYKLNKDLNNIIWGKDDNDHDINYKAINNFYKINFLDTYYDMNEKQLYLINCNENNTEIISSLFEYNNGVPFKYNGWNYYHSAFMKEINKVLKLFQLSPNGIAIWDFKNNKVAEAFKYFDDICLYDFIFWNSDYIITISDKKIITLKISGENIEIKAQKNKEKGYSKIRKIISPENSEIIVAIDNHQVKYWSF